MKAIQGFPFFNYFTADSTLHFKLLGLELFEVFLIDLLPSDDSSAVLGLDSENAIVVLALLGVLGHGPLTIVLVTVATCYILIPVDKLLVEGVVLHNVDAIVVEDDLEVYLLSASMHHRSSLDVSSAA